MGQLDEEINKLINQFVSDQAIDGSWQYPFETGISTDCYMIILIRTLELNEEDLIKSLVERIRNKQEPNGAWKLFYDEEEGNITATFEAYYALLYSGYLDVTNTNMQKAKQFILAKGGITEIHMFTKIMLAITGQYDWPHFPISILAVLLPKTFPINLFDLSVYGRANIVPILILADAKFSKKTQHSPDLSDLFLKRNEFVFQGARFFNSDERFHSFFSKIFQDIQLIKDLPNSVRSTALQRAEQYMTERIEPDGTLCNYFSSTFLMIFALLARGHSKKDPLIKNAIQGLKSMICRIDGDLHCQYTTATVWNTGLVSYVLQEAGVPNSNKTIQKANQYLLSRQHSKYGDWVLHNPDTTPGGWGFANLNTIHPDIDDSTVALRAIREFASKNENYRKGWNRGINWVVSMQNSDGGWAAFEKNMTNKLLNLLPIEGGKDLLNDPSTVDLTGRTLEFFGNYTNLTKKDPIIKRGIDWLLKQQKEDGSWVGRWGVHIYGTWAAISGLLASGIPPTNPNIQKGLKWLHASQNPDGGWGESCRSDMVNHYVPLKKSSRTHTAWAIDTLILTEYELTPAINKGIEFLINDQAEDWTRSYPKGSGMAGAFYIDYHCYEYVWPLLALAHFKEKFS